MVDLKISENDFVSQKKLKAMEFEAKYNKKNNKKNLFRLTCFLLPDPY